MAHSASSTELFLSLKRTESTFEEIPVIDIQDARTTDPAARRQLADLIRDACINIGFFYSASVTKRKDGLFNDKSSYLLVKSHGIPDAIIDNTVNAGKSFFSLSEATKMQLDIHNTPNFKGYTALLGENTDLTGLGDLHEGFDLGWEPPIGVDPSSFESRKDVAMDGENVWPPDFPEFRETVLDYYHRVVEVGKLLFPLFALALDLPENFFDDKTTRPAAIMRLLHYPPQATRYGNDFDERQIGIGAHTDYECFTILWQDRAGGLQVQNTAGKWVDAVPIPGTMVVNLGDQFARWTNDIFKSTPHRVINRSGAERYSIPLFFGTDYDVLLEPIPTCVTPGSPYKYEIMSAGQYVKSRLEATYAHSSAPS